MDNHEFLATLLDERESLFYDINTAAWRTNSHQQKEVTVSSN